MFPVPPPFGLDLLDEDHRIAGDHAHQRQNAENRDDAEARSPINWR
jgi:hypothetical protein